MKILFITANYIGDAVRTTGILAHYLEQYPHAKVTIACGEPAQALFLELPNLERIIVVRKQRFSLHWLKLWACCVGCYWDVIIDFRRSPVSTVLFAKKKLQSLKKKLEFSYPNKVWFSSSSQNKAAQLFSQDKPLLVISPTTTKRAKEWGYTAFAELIHRLVSQEGLFYGWQVAIAVRSDEVTRIQPLIDALVADRVTLVTQPLSVVIALLNRAQFFIGCDSALMHIAAALAVPTLGLFGPTRVEHYAPKGPYAMTVCTDKTVEELLASVSDYEAADSLMDSLSVDKVMQAVLQLWNALPQDKRTIGAIN